MKRSMVRDLRARELEERGDLHRAEAERLIATHLYARRGYVARGFRRKLTKRPRGLHHALSARHPNTRRRLLHTAALVLLDLLEDDAGPPAADSGARRVFGKTQAWYAKVLGFSQRRNKNGEVNGARHVRTCLRQLEALGFIRRGGRAWFNAPPGAPRDKHRRLVLWIRPWDDTLIARLADALGVDLSSGNAALPSSEIPSSRISGSGCFTSPSLPISSVGEGSPRGEENEEGASRHLLSTETSSPSTTPVENPVSACSPSTENTEGPSAPANKGESASAIPTVGADLDPVAAIDMLGVGVLRVLRGEPLAAVVQHIASTHQRPADTWDGRSASSSPDTSNAAPTQAQDVSGPTWGPRPHPAPCNCPACVAWAAAVVAAPASPRPMRSISAPAWVGRAPAPLLPHAIGADSSVGSPPASALDAIGLFRSNMTTTLDEATSIRVSWQRHPDADYPLAAVVNGERWRLRFNGPGDCVSPRPGRDATPFRRWSPLTLVVDGRELGLVRVDRWPLRWELPVIASRKAHGDPDDL